MRNKLSAIIIDPNFLYHDYSGIKTNVGGEYAENYFDLKILESGHNILHEINNFKGFDALVTVGNVEGWDELVALPFAYRKKWTHQVTFNAQRITNAIVETFKYNINRADAPKSFSIFTCTFNTDEFALKRLYNSIKAQTYTEWDWFILDDSLDDKTQKLIESLDDPRITVFHNISHHGNIGFNKHMIAMMCDGDYLVEVDHDDELTPDCLQWLFTAFNTEPKPDFVFSHAIELKNGDPIVYGNGWGWGEGLNITEKVNGVTYTFSDVPPINPFSIRTIYAQPNHVRCWEKNFYHRIGGHNTELSVLDDMDLLIRTFLYGKMTKVEKTLYFQHEGEGKREDTSSGTAQSRRFNEIQRTLWFLKDKYDKQIHDRIIELGHNDNAWDDNAQTSVLWKEHTPGQEIMCNIIKPS